MGSHPCYLGVAGDILLWSCSNPLVLTGYNFRTRSIITLERPPLEPPNLALQTEPDWNPAEFYYGYLYVAANVLWGLGEDRNQGFNFLRRYVGGAWEVAVGEFDLPEGYGMVNGLCGSSSDFTKLLFLNNEDHLVLFHSVPQEGEYSTTMVDVPGPDPAHTVAQTIDFLDLSSIQFEETIFFPECSGGTT